MNPPSRRDRLKPFEFIGMAFAIALFTGIVVLVTTRQPLLATVFFGIAFIVSLVTIAMLMLAIKPDAAEKIDLDTQENTSDKGH